MKRSWIGFFLLLVLLAGSIAVTWAMDRIHQPIEANLKQAAECAILGDWDNADRFFHRGQQQWEAWAHFRGCFADHSPIEEIEAGFALLKVYCDTRENAAFAADCCKLARQVAAVGEAHGLVWWNIL